jgi:hypothetical protein
VWDGFQWVGGSVCDSTVRNGFGIYSIKFGIWKGGGRGHEKEGKTPNFVEGKNGTK